jgi:hypothetical protein
MQKLIQHIAVILLIFCGLMSNTFAQQKDLDLKASIEMFEAGQYPQVIERLQGSVDNGLFSEELTVQAFKYLIAAYYEMDEIEQAEKYVKLFYEKHPVYRINVTDPLGFVTALNRFEIKPLLTLSTNIGFSRIEANVMNRFSVWEPATYDNPYKTSFDFLIYAGINWNFLTNWSLSAGAEFKPLAYSRSVTAAPNFEVKYNEVIHFFKVPLELHYTLPLITKWKPEVFGGYYYSRIIDASAGIALTDKHEDGTFFEKNENAINVTESRRKNNHGLIGGAGVSMNLKRFVFSLSLAYSMDLQSFTYKGLKYDNKDLIADFHYIDDDLKFRNFDLYFGVKYNFLYKITPKYR